MEPYDVSGGGAEPSPAVAQPAPGEPPGDSLPLLPGFREMALRRMSAQRQSAGLSQTEVAARMGTSQSAVARLEAGEADLRVSTLERYAAAIGNQIHWQIGLDEDRAGHEEET